MAGYFHTNQYEDILVGVRRQSNLNHGLHLLDGLSGQLLWSLETVGLASCTETWPLLGAGSALSAVLDWDGDGLDEALELAQESLSVVNGTDGSVLWRRFWIDCEPPSIFDINAGIEAIPVVADFLGTGGEQILFGKTDVTLAILELDGDAVWHTPINPAGVDISNKTLQGVADLDGDGDLDIVAAGHCSTPGEEVRAYEAATGQLRWALSMPETCPVIGGPVALTSGDLDGDGRDEVLISVGNVLRVVGEESGQGLLRWRATFVAEPGELNPVIADVDGSGRPQILINISTAYLYSLGYGGRFDDVGLGHWAFSFIESLADSGITAGCGGGNYCPEGQVTRAQMAVFLERGINGSSFSPPAATGTVFDDVGAGDFAASFIERLHADGITGGCGGNNFCPNNAVSRAQMAVFLLRAKHGAGYAPPPAAGIFNDVDLSYWAVHWIEQLAAEGITSGCGNGNYCPEDPVTRDQMAVFLVRTFGI